ncbi:type III endosome membrane protein TEMP isoform X1 [Clarias gariepinus]|uniref:type III endosome membrane protein TEMP isoform X1 n=1 Tax=Clarias gariepinus TaxID=13013 RepID=UPI00234C216D|nr:type III endosome membrane protein TEMP isoform X1 [Clarias gariepinus]
MCSSTYTLCMLFSLWASCLCHTLVTVGPCVADTEEATFDCSRRNLTSIPQQIWPNVTELDLSENHLHLLHTKILKKLKHFKHLVKFNLSANYLPLLVKQHFYHLPSLEILDLSGCKLAAVKPEALLSFPRLQKLFLDNDVLQTPVPAVLRLHGWIEVLDHTSNLHGSDKPKEVVQAGWRRKRHSGEDFNMDTNGLFLRKLLVVSENTETRNTTGDNEKRSPDAWKYLVAALVTAISLSVLITIGAKCKLIHRYWASYRHSRLSEGDGASQCDPANFEVGFSSHGNIPNSNMVNRHMEDDDDGFIEDNYIQASERERAEREVDHWQEDDEDEDEGEDMEEFSIG